MLAFRPADSENAPRQPLKPVGISQATADSQRAVADATPVASVPSQPPVMAAPDPAFEATVPAPEPAPVKAAPVEPEPEQAQPAPPAPAEEIDLPWNEPKTPVADVIPEPVAEPAEAPVAEPVLETLGEQPDLTPMPTPAPASPVPDAPQVEEQQAQEQPAEEPQPVAEQAVTPAMLEAIPDAAYLSAPMGRDDEPPPDDDYVEPDVDIDPASYAYLDELAHESVGDAEPVEPEPTPAAMPATGLALEWLEMFPGLPISGMTGSIAANCTLISIDGDHWLLHLDPAHSALFNATQQRRLNDALNQYHGRTLTITIELIKPEQETPAQAATRRRINRQREAEDSIHGDPLIQQMMQQFGAVVRQDTIEPVEAPVPQAS